MLCVFAVNRLNTLFWRQIEFFVVIAFSVMHKRQLHNLIRPLFWKTRKWRDRICENVYEIWVSSSKNWNLLFRFGNTFTGYGEWLFWCRFVFLLSFLLHGDMKYFLFLICWFFAINWTLTWIGRNSNLII